MLALTYQQQPKKEKTTIRLKRIGQRFLPSYKHIREQRFDVFGTFSRKKATKQFISILSKRLPSIRIRKTYGLTKQRVRSKVMKFKFLKETQRPSVDTKVLKKSTMLYSAFPWFDKQSFNFVIKRVRTSGEDIKGIFNQNLLQLPQQQLAIPKGRVSGKLIKILHPTRKPKKRYAHKFNKQKKYPRVDTLSLRISKKMSRRGELQYVRGVDQPHYKYRSYNLAALWKDKLPFLFGSRATRVTSQLFTFPQKPKIIRKYKFTDYKKEKRSRPAFSGPLQLFWNQIRGNKVLGDLSGFLRSKFFSRLRRIQFRIDQYSENKRRKRSSVYKSMVLAYRRLRLFYGHLKEHKMRLLLRKTTGRQHASFIFGKMERRLDVLLWRTNFCNTIHIAQQLVKRGLIVVDGVTVRNYFYPIKSFQFISFKTKQIRNLLKLQLIEKFRLKKIKFPILKYIKIDYKTLIFYCIPIVQPYQFVPMSYKLKHASLRKYIK